MSNRCGPFAQVKPPIKPRLNLGQTKGGPRVLVNLNLGLTPHGVCVIRLFLVGTTLLDFGINLGRKRQT